MESSQELSIHTNCRSCGFQFESHLHFCPNCGGKVIKNRMTVKLVFIEFFQNLFNVDSRFIQTFKDLVLKPEEVFKAFVSGARRRYYHPVSFLAVALVFYVLVSNLLPFDVIQVNSAVQEQSFALGYKSAKGSSEGLEEKLKDEEVQREFEESREANRKFQESFNNFMQNNASIVAYLNIPVYALIGFLVFYKRKLYNYAEMICIVLYQNAFTTFLGFATIPIFYLLGWSSVAFIVFSTATIFLYSNYSFQRLFNLNVMELILANLRFLLVTVIISILFFILLLIVMLPIMLLNKFI